MCFRVFRVFVAEPERPDDAVRNERWRTYLLGSARRRRSAADDHGPRRHAGVVAPPSDATPVGAPTQNNPFAISNADDSFSTVSGVITGDPDLFLLGGYFNFFQQGFLLIRERVLNLRKPVLRQLVFKGLWKFRL